MGHRLLIVALSFTLAFVVASQPAGAAPCWLAPVAGTVSDPFREPPCPYCAGNRGIEYDVGKVAVRAVAGGVVTWSGSVAGTRYLVVRHANRWRATYGQLVSSPLSAGDRVVARMSVGVASGSFYFGLRVEETYIDPAKFIGRLVGRPRLVPVDGTQRRDPPSPRLRCMT